MHRASALLAVLILAFTWPASAQTGAAVRTPEPFKLGTFEIDTYDRIGIVIRDQLVVELDAANRALERNPIYPRMRMPEDMIDLIGQYDYGMRYRLYEIVNDLVDNDRLGANRPAFVHDARQVRTLAPIANPTKILNAAGNYYGHLDEQATPEQQAAAQEQRRRDRGVPYLFHKTTVGAIIGDGDHIVIPHGRDRTDWEVELGVVIGRAARYVPANRAADHIFGYTILLDMSDRAGRPPGGFGQGSDWYVGKGHDTFAPMGPWIVPKEFYGDPMRGVRQALSLDNDVVQDSNTHDMIHNVYELIEYGSSIATLFPGDIIAAGSPAGTGAGTYLRGEQRFIQPGETVIATIEGIGTLTHPTRAGDPPPTGTGMFLPPRASYDP
jgi:2-keto-4-pentenoate hydratase/2-oxohepta-3-ene-1,7-dioic acid hydratase in catechol pathway